MESQPVKACLDTHAVLWSLAGDSRLGKKAAQIIASSSRADLVISDLVLLEVSYLHAKGRIQDAEGLEALLSKISENFRVVSISPEIAKLALDLKLPHGDPFDRVIVATAKAHNVPLLTRDRAITDSGAVKTIW
ncbi:MAG: type II toxin-antitoxin system VapC family toxin [Luteolibacter sp.]